MSPVTDEATPAPVTVEAPGLTDLTDKTVLIVGINYAPDGVGIAPYTTQLAEYLHARGARVEVVTGMPYYPDYRLRPEYKKSISRRELSNGVWVRRVRHSVPSRMTAMRRGVHELSFFLHAMLRRPPVKPDIVIGVTPAVAGTLAASRMAKRYRVPSLMIVQDLSGPGARQSGIPGGHFWSGSAERIEAMALRHATRVTVLHPRFVPYVTERMGVPTERVRVVRNWSYAMPQATPRELVRSEQGWPDELPVVLYGGNMGLKMGLTNVVEAGRLADQRGENIRFVLVGDGSQRAALAEQARDVRSVQLVESRFGSGFADILAAADVLLINELPTVSNMSLPSKLAYYFPSARPVLAAVSAEGTTALEVQLANAGEVIEPGDPELLLNSAVKLAGDSERCAELGRNGREYAATAYDRDVILASYAALVAEAIDQGARR